MSSATLSYDLLCLIFHTLQEDNATVSQCALVNRGFSRAASRSLYSNVVLSAGDSSRVSSAALPHNASYVQVLSILSTECISPAMLLDAVKAFENMHTLEILPKDWQTFRVEDLLDGILLELKNRASLVKLRVNPSCTTEATAPILADIGGLRELALASPSRAILQLLPDWLERLSPSLRELHLTGNCGSITPGILRSFAPLLANLTAFSLGLSYSIVDDDLFDFLGQLPCLETVQLQHYVQFKPAQKGALLSRLRSLTVLHQPFYEEDHATRLATSVLHALSGAPAVERVRLCCEEYEEDAEFAPRGLDALLDHLTPTCSTLRVLDLGGSLVSELPLTAFCRAAVALEELTIALDMNGFTAFKNLVPTMSCLHTATLKVYTIGCRLFLVNVEDADRIMQSSVVLRRLAVNGMRTEGSWVCERHGDGRFVVVEVASRRAGRQESNPPSMGMILEEEEEEE
ncbi:hypothetical protein FB45DRAFT_930844 [Roridomyces roridus]|uniref:F-box domain-containing protein n=1 Tax=Roridomyces roridus TaxID=1738132 RepID=A0AAD7BFE7_9AGAR|nr:hypothetical protein FB45DRAFT_930844 [Roridomyces roridus]